MDLSGLTFTKKSATAGGSTPCAVDVSVTAQGKGKYMAFSFSSKAFGLMGQPGALNAAISGSRIYFLESSTKTGFIIGKKDSSTRPCCRFPAGQLAPEYAYVGFYDLKWDRDRELFYIDLSKRRQA